MPYKDRIKQREFEREWQRKRRAKRYEIIAEKYGRFCYKCGRSNCVLDFHHIDPDSKIDNISTMAHDPDYIVEAELDKCVRLCRKCHHKEHRSVLKRISCGTPNPYVAGSNPATPAKVEEVC